MTKRCESCQFWLFAYDSSFEGAMGTCDHPVVEGKITLEASNDSDIEEQVIHTSGDFGCIYHTPLHGNVVTKIDIDE